MKITNDIYLAPKERFPELEDEPDEEPSPDEMDRADERAERMANRRNRGEE